ncbi:MAG: DUF1559 domain-containing protein [Planctomycetes bacterium]|nr:DUF1559 domain-containing protein [Planctomycetota bacterium]
MGTKRRAFTLVELLVVIAIIGVLVALLLPAVQAAREAARRMQCQNNLKQLGLAMHNYTSSFKESLPGGVGRYGCCWGTWQMSILPFIEAQNLADIYVNLGGADWGPRYGTAINRPVVSSRLPTLSCPSDIKNAPIGATATLLPVTSHNYGVNYGNTSFFQTPLNGIPFLGAPFRAYTQSTSDDGPIGAAAALTFPRVYGQHVTLAEIVDGTSNTLMAAEVLQGRGTDLRGFSWWGGASGFVTYLAPNSSAPDVITGGYCTSLTSPRMPCVTATTATRPRMMGARSVHAAGGVNVAFCDGHVRFLMNGIDYKVWNYLGTSQGSEAVNPDE